jgi:hypothetical protein
MTRHRQDQAHVFDDDWCVDQITAQPNVESAAAKTIELAMVAVRAERKAKLRVVHGERAS